MTERQKKQIGLSSRWKNIQVYSFQFAMGSLSAYIIWVIPAIEKVFTKIHWDTFYQLSLVGIIIVGTISVFFSGGIGLFRLINAKRILQIIEQGGKDDKSQH